MEKTKVIRDGFKAIQQATISASDKVIRSWFYAPFGLMVMLTACFGIDVAFKKMSVSFPASVAGLVLLFLGLLAMEAMLGSHKTRKATAIIGVSAGWALRWMGVFFTPSFILLPLSQAIGIIEVLKIIAVFVIGFFVMMALAAYITRGCQLLFGSSKRAMTERAEELGGTQTPDMPINENSEGIPDSSRTSISAVGSTIPLRPVPSSRPASPPQARLPGTGTSASTGTSTPDNTTFALNQAMPSQHPLPKSRSEKWAGILVSNLDILTFTSLFFFVGIPVYFSLHYAMPLHLSITVLAYFAAVALPASWKRFLHPVIVCAFFSVLIIWAFAAMHGDTLYQALHAYRTGAKYLQLWESAGNSNNNNNNNHQQLRKPGAGDVFGTLLDASIVALALPMFQYRRELRTHFLSLVIPSVTISIGSLFAYPPLCRAIGIAAERSLSFASRSLTLALAVPATENLGGDANTVAALAIISDILGVLVGQRLLTLFKIPEDDYVTRGVTLGVNSSAIATAVLLRTDPRAAALSSVSMTLFGTVTVLFTSIPPLAGIVKSLVGL